MKQKDSMATVGHTFGLLTVVSLDPDKHCSRQWLCRCQCGTGKSVQERHLLSSHMKNYGCRGRQVGASRTCVEKIACQKLISANTSGHRGVSRRSNGTWRACMDFRGKRYDLGTNKSFDEAVAARLEDEIMYQSFLENYYAQRMQT